ncbi:MAG: hypothetical protein OK457_10630, partial [Thaumarchaeota archaeon]|nr:hypothetical protein [Nitrososphaerota archaeon]
MLNNEAQDRRDGLAEIVVDAHEDIAFNATALHMDFLSEIATLRTLFKEGTPTVCLPELKRGNVRIIFATIWAAPCGDPSTSNLPCYKTAEEAHSQGLDQLKYYRKLEQDGHISIIESRTKLEEVLESSFKVGVVLLMEGADPMRFPAEAKT